ncbi:MAG: polysaccharide biosynthesis/export family protein, partial [Nitrospirae bacterium]|nr:polysaccharide biosynthesis/export family protein [Nitrospirota bacterium]
MFKRAIILLAIIGIIITGCSKKVVKSEGSISEDKGSLLTEDMPLEAVKDDANLGDEYIIGAEDVLEVMVWRSEMLSRPRVVVRPDGKISLPLIGDIQAAGFTPNQLKDYIVKRLKEYQELPTVTVIVSEINSYYIYILGEVVRPGRYQLKSNISVLQAVTLAGGFTSWASPNSMVVLRRNGEKEEKLRVRYKKI